MARRPPRPEGPPKARWQASTPSTINAGGMQVRRRLCCAEQCHGAVVVGGARAQRPCYRPRALSDMAWHLAHPCAAARVRLPVPQATSSSSECSARAFLCVHPACAPLRHPPTNDRVLQLRVSLLPVRPGWQHHQPPQQHRQAQPEAARGLSTARHRRVPGSTVHTSSAAGAVGSPHG